MLDFDPCKLERLVQGLTGRPPEAVDPMPGGASTRSYHRVHTGAEPASLVAMFVPDSAPEEVTSGARRERWPFLEVRDLLESRGVRVPRVHAEACDAGLILIEDLGDETLGAFVERAPVRREEVYRMAVRHLARAQRALGDLPSDSAIATRAFDEKLLRWELEHFREWGLDARGKALDVASRAAFDGIADRLASRIAAWPRGFVHRDYQSRNLMVLEADGELELVWIDFQDALLGPRVYDLVALLNDSYVELDRAFVEARLDDYADAAGLDADGRAALGREFDLVTVQRKLKDAGRFVFIDRVKKNPAFLRFVEPTLAKVRAALGRLEADADMRQLGRLVAQA